MKLNFLMKKPLRTVLITMLLLVAIPTTSVLAVTSSEIIPVGNGAYTAWSGLYLGINEGTGAASCINGDYISTATPNARRSVTIPLTSIPNGSTIIDINVLARDHRATVDGGTYATFIRLNEVDSVDSSPHTVAGSGAACTGSVNDAFDIIDTVKKSSTKLEIGVMKLNEVALRVGVLSAVITYTLPPNSAGTAGSGADLATVGTVIWSDPGNVVADDDVYATASVGGAQTHFLHATNFGFTIPSGSTIYGVQATIGRFEDAIEAGNDVQDVVVRLAKNGTAVGNNRVKTALEWPTAETVATYGSTSDLWGTALTADIINSPTFGLVLSVNSANNRIASVDYVQLTISYSPPATTTTVNCVSNPITYGDSTTCTATVTRSAGSNTPDSTVSWLTDASGGFATSPCALSGAGASATCSVTYTPSSIGDGTHPITASYEGSSNFQPSSGHQTLTVNPATLTVSGITAADKVYDGTTSATLGGTAALLGVINSEDVTLGGTPVGVFGDKNVGVSKPVMIAGFTISGADIGNYSLTQPSSTASITARTLTVTANNRAVHVGNPDPAFTFNVSGLVSPDIFSVNPTCGVSGAHTTAGTYPIVCSGGDAGANYAITNVDGTLTVTDKIVLEVTTANLTITYGDPTPSFTPIITGFVDGDNATVLNTPPTCSATGPFTPANSPFVITCSGGFDDKYEFNYASGTLTVVPVKIVASYNSVALQDGWILEATETTNSGGKLNSIGTTFRVGDDALDRQYRSILSFDVTSLPADAVITKVTLKVTYQGKTGTNAFDTHKLLVIDLKAGVFGTSSALQKADFKNGAMVNVAGSIGKTPVSTGPNVHAAVLTQAAVDKLNAQASLTLLQLRLRFQKDDNDDLSADFLRFYSGNSTITNTQPVLIIEYYIP